MTRPVQRMSKADYEMLAQFRCNLRKFLHFSEDAAETVGLTPQQYIALLFIKGQPNREYMSVGELAEWLQVRHHSAVGLVNRLVSQGLIERQTSTVDRRRVNLFLTGQGTVILDKLATVHREELRHLEPDLTASLQRVVLKRVPESRSKRSAPARSEAMASIA